MELSEKYSQKLRWEDVAFANMIVLTNIYNWLTYHLTSPP